MYIKNLLESARSVGIESHRNIRLLQQGRDKKEEENKAEKSMVEEEIQLE